MTRMRLTLKRMVAAIALLVAGGCWNAHREAPLGPDDVRPVRLSLRAVASAQAGATVDVRAAYARRDGSAVPLGTASAALVPGGNEAVRLTVDIAPCLRDPERAGGDGEACAATLEVRLLRGTALLDERRLPVTLQPGRDVEVPQEVSLFEVGRVVVTTSSGGGAEIEVRQTLALTAAVTEASGTPVTGRAVEWQSLQPGVATVDPRTGVVTGMSAGSAVVRAIAGGRAGELTVVVALEGVRRVEILPGDTTVVAGGSFRYRVRALGRDENVLAVPITFTVDNPAVASVSPDGTVLARSAGIVRVTASTSAGANGATVSSVATLRVEGLPVIVLSPTTLNFRVLGGAPLPAPQTVTVTNGGGGTLGTLRIEGASEPVAATLSGAAAPATLSVSATRVLAPGESVTRTIVVRSSTPNVAPASLTVTVSGDTPSPVIVDRAVVDLGTLDSAQVSGVAEVAVTTDSGRTLDRLTANTAYGTSPPGWLDVRLNGGATPTTLRITGSAGALPAGIYTAIVTVASGVEGSRPATVTVRMQVRDRAVLAVSPDTIDFGVIDSGTVSTIRLISITEIASRPIRDLRIQTAYPVGTRPWLRASFLDGVTTTPTTARVQATADSLPPGRHTASYLFSSTTSTVAVRRVVAVVTVGRLPIASLIPDRNVIGLGPIAPGTLVTSSVNLRRSDGGLFTRDALQNAIGYAAGERTGWLSLAQTFVIGAPSPEATHPVRFTASSSSLPPGTYRAFLNSSLSGVRGSVVTVTLQVGLPPAAGIAPLGCSQEPALRSTSGDTPTSLTIQNTTSGILSFYWLNYSGARVLYGSVGPGDAYEQLTYLTHPWLITNAAGACLGIYLPTAGAGRIIVR